MRKNISAIQREEFKRLGVLGDWEHPYRTLDPAYEAQEIRELGKIVASGALYRQKKPVYWCASCVTALAEAEVEYEDHTSPSIYVKFAVKDSQGLFPVDPVRRNVFRDLDDDALDFAGQSSDRGSPKVHVPAR